MALLPEHSALQHERAPAAAAAVPRTGARGRRATIPELARDALAGLRAYEIAPRARTRRDAEARNRARRRRMPARSWRRRPAGGSRPVADQPAAHPRSRRPGVAGRRDRAHGPARACCSTGARRRSARGPDRRRAMSRNCCCRCCASIGEPAALIGYCLGGTMAIAAANLVAVRARRHPRRPWNFSLLSGRVATRARATCGAMREPAAERSARCRWKCCRPLSGRSIPSAPCENSPNSAALDPASAEARRFVELEDWANEGEPLPYPGRERTDRGFVRPTICRASGNGGSADGAISDGLAVPTLHLTAARDRIAPAATAPAGDDVAIPSGHVGMIVGSARAPAPRGARGIPRPRLPLRRPPLSRRAHAPVAQLDRALPSEGRGHRFESCRVRHRQAIERPS